MFYTKFDAMSSLYKHNMNFIVLTILINNFFHFCIICIHFFYKIPCVTIILCKYNLFVQKSCPCFVTSAMTQHC